MTPSRPADRRIPRRGGPGPTGVNRDAPRGRPTQTGGGAPAGPLGVIAGRGALPVEVAEGAHRAGRRVVCVNAFDADPRLCEIADDYHTLALGHLGAMVETFRSRGVREIVLAGKVDKLAAAGGASLDALGLRVANRLTDFGDAAILRALVAALEESGFVVAPQARYAPHLIAAAGVLGRRVPTGAEQADIAFAMRIASAAAAMDIGQAIAVRRGIVIAVEAAEGTDGMIARAGALATGAVIVKIGRPHQDPRYDLPAVGPQTIAQVAAAHGAALAVEAEHTLLFERDRAIAEADRAGIAFVAVPRVHKTGRRNPRPASPRR